MEKGRLPFSEGSSDKSLAVNFSVIRYKSPLTHNPSTPSHHRIIYSKINRAMYQQKFLHAKTGAKSLSCPSCTPALKKTKNANDANDATIKYF